MDLQHLVSRYGSPLYIYDLAELKSASKRLFNSLPDGSILFYSLKANPHPYLVKELVKQGCRCEVSSLAELRVALQAGGIAEQILYTGPVKTYDELEEALKLGVIKYSCESTNELNKLSLLAEKHRKKVQVILRVNPNHKYLRSSLSMTGVASQFGIDEDKIAEIPPEFITSPYMDIVGFHVFNGTNSNDVDSMISSFTYSIHMAKRLSEQLKISLKFLDLGGGFGHPYAQKGNSTDFSSIKTEISAVLDLELADWRQQMPEISFESGRNLVAACGQYVCTVEEIKESKGEKFIILDGGINHLGGMSGLGRMQKFDMDYTCENDHAATDTFSASMVGPLCTPLDLMRRSQETQSLFVQDIIIVPNVGAYGLTASLMGFLSRETPVEVIYEHHTVCDATQIILNRQTIDK
ncbi:type III PLP-dependent enzyme [Paenibacillus sp. YSY-4.3]